MSTPPRTIRRDTRFFISAVTRELGSVRKLVKKGLEDNDYHAVEQDNFPPDYRDLVDKLRERIASCDAVIHIAGHCYGAEPAHRPPDAPRRSYTQLEHDIAVELGKPVYVFLTGEGFPTDPHDPEPPEVRELQQAHRHRLTATGKDYNPTTSTEQLDQKVRGLRLKVERLEEELHHVDHKVALTGRRLGRWLAVVAILGIAALGAVGYFGWRQQAEYLAQQREREKQDLARKADEVARKEVQKVKDVYREVAEGLLQELLNDKQVTAEEARRRALEKLPKLVKLPLAEIESLIDRKIPPSVQASLSSLDKARAAVAKGDYDAVFPLAAEQSREGREMAMIEGTAALARFRQSPSPEWNERALTAFRRAMALADPNSATDWEAWTDAAGSAASVLMNIARYTEAEQLLRECQRYRESKSGPDSPGLGVVLNNLGGLLRLTNRPAEAEPLFRHALAIYERSLGPGHTDVAMSLNNLAELLRSTNRPAAAEPLFRRALAISERSLGPDNPTVATRLNNLAELLWSTNRPAEAEPLFRRALAIYERSLGPGHPTVATCLSNLAVLFQSTNRPAEAEPLFRRALAIHERSLGPGHTDVAMSLNNLAELLGSTGRLAEAEPLFRRALAIDERSLGPDHPIVSTCLNNLAKLLWSMNRPTEAEPLYRRALAISERSLGPGNPGVATDLNNLAVLLGSTDRPAEAEPLYRRVINILARIQRSTGHQHPNFASAITNYREHLAIQKLAESEINARIKAASQETGELAAIVPEVERLLGPARSVADVLSSLDRQYEDQAKPSVYFLKPEEPIAPHLDELLRANADGLAMRGVAAFRSGSHADAVVLCETSIELLTDQPAQTSVKLRIQMQINRAAALRELGLVERASEELSRLMPELERLPETDFVMNGRAKYHLALCRWRLDDRAGAQAWAEKSLVAYEAAPKADPVPAGIRLQSEELLDSLKDGKAPPPLAAVDAQAAIDAARARYRAREALTKLGLKEPSAPLLDQILGPARPTKEVFEALDRQYREQGKPPVWFLPLNEPISPHLDELLGKPVK